MTKPKSKIKWCIPVTKTLDSALEEAVSGKSYSSKSEFVRDAVRRKLEEIQFKHQSSTKNSGKV